MTKTFVCLMGFLRGFDALVLGKRLQHAKFPEFVVVIFDKTVILRRIGLKFSARGFPLFC